MRILVIGTGGVGSAFAAIAQRRSFFDRITLADLDPSRPQSVVDRLGEHDRFNAARVDASSEDSIVALIRDVKADAVLNATDPRFNPQIFDACLQARVTYLDMAATLSQPHPEHPYSETHVKLGDYQFAQHENWVQEGQLALVGIGIEPGAADVFARHAADELFSEIDEVGIRDGANLVVEGYDFAPTFSIWTTIEECLNPPVIWEKGRGWFTTRAVLRARDLRLPRGDRPGRVRQRRARGGAAGAALDRLQARHVQVRARGRVHRRSQDASQARARLDDEGARARRRGGAARRRRGDASRPATLGDRMVGKTCAGTLVTGLGKDGRPRKTYLYHVVDNEWSMREYGSQAVVWQTAINPVVALELLAEGAWSGSGVLGPEAFPAQPFLDKLAAFGSPHGVLELTP